MNHPATPTTHTTSLTSATQNHSSTFPQVPAGHSAFEDDEEDEDDFDADAALLRSLTLAGSDFVYKSDFDKNGIVYHLGCDVEGGVWTNPALLSPPTIKVTSSGRHTTYSEVLHLSRTPVVALTSASQGSWICFDFLDRAIIPTHYTLRHYTQASYALRNWVFEGSIDGEEWVVLRQHINDTSLAARDATRTWAIELDAQQQQQQQQAAASNEPFLVEPYRKFRIRMTGPNSSNSWHLVCSGFEIYGKLIDYGALNANGRSSAFAGSAGLTCPPNPMWFHKVILSQQYMLAFHAATSMSTTPHLPTFDMFRIPLEFAKSIWMDFQASTNELVERKGGNLAFARTARQSSTAILSPHLLTPARAAAVYSHTPYGFGSAQHAVDGYFQDSVFTQACTQVEESPWFEVDLGTLHLVGEVMVALKRKIEPPTLENQSSAEKDEIPDALPSLMPAMANVAARANLNVNASSSPESIASDDSLPPIGAPITSDNPMMSPRLMRQISLIKNPTPPVAAAPNYLVLLADTPFPVRQTGVAFVESLKSHALFVAPLAPISSPSHALESSALHVKIDHSSASSTSATPIPRARFVRILYTGKGDLRLNQVAVFPPVNQTAIKPTLATTTSTGAPNTASTGANTEPPAPNASPSNSASTAASSNVGLSLAQRIQQITASSSSTSSSTSTATTPASTGLSSSVTSSSSSADPAALVPFYISVSLFNNKVALELLTYLHRLCEKRGINIMELNILAEQSDKDNKDPAAHSGLQLPFTPTELLQYPELSRLGSDIYENVSVIKLYLLLIQHFNKIIMGLLPLIDFSVQKKNTKVVVNPVVPEFSSISPTTALHLADSIRNIRHFLLWSSKRNVWEQSLAATVQSLPKPNIDVDLFAASEVAWSKKTDHHARRTVFGQVFSQRAKLPSVHFRLIRSSRAFTVNYVGMRATDAGGPYRDAFERMGNELQSQLLPLFIKVPNSVYEGSAANGGVDLWVPRPSSTSSQQLLMYEFVGKLVGLAIRTKNLWNLSWPSLVWKFLVQEEIHDNDIRMVDALAASQMERMHVILQAMTSVAPPTPTSSGSSSTAIDPAVLNNVLSSSNASSPCVKFTLLDSENRVQALIPNGHNINVTHSNFVDYVRATREYRVHEFDVQLKAIKRGLSSVIPPSVLSLLTWRELENQVCGRGLGVDSVELLEKMTKYSACARSDRHIDLFWRMLRERFTDEQRAQFLIFTYGRSRLPASSADVDTSFTIMRAAARPINPANPPLTIAQLQAQLDRQLPTSHTCGFALELPAFSSLDVMTERMLYAIAHCSEVDADGGNARTGNYRIEEEEDEETDDDDNGYEE